MIHSYIPFYTLICFLAVYLVFSSPISGFWRVLPKDLIINSPTGMTYKISQIWWILQMTIFFHWNVKIFRINLTKTIFDADTFWKFDTIACLTFVDIDEILVCLLCSCIDSQERISLNKMPAVIFYLNVHGNHILPQFLFSFFPFK